MKDLINRFVFFIGWILSPFTFWNDAFVNIPISYIAASIFTRFIHIKFVLLVLICYWSSNVVGLIMMFVSGRALIKPGKGAAGEIAKLVFAIVIYSVALVLLSKIHVLRPIKLPI